MEHYNSGGLKLWQGRVLHKMTWLRIVTGISLLVFVLLLSGTVSQFFASSGHFALAEKLMISPAWMEAYKPEVKAYIEAGVLYQNGDFEGALEAFQEIENNEASAAMKSVTAIKLAWEKFDDGAYDAAYDTLLKAEYTRLPDSCVGEYEALRSALYEYYRTAGAADEQVQVLLEMQRV